MKDLWLVERSSGSSLSDAWSSWMMGLWFTWAVTLSGCQSLVNRTAVSSVRPKPVAFAGIYQQWVPENLAGASVEEERRITISADQMTVAEFVRTVSDQAGVSVIVESGLETKTITMEIRYQPIGEVLNFVARRFKVNVRKQGTLYYLGALQPDDRGVLVRRVRRLSKEQLTEVLQVFSGQNGRSAQFADGLIVVGDSVEVLGRINEMINLVEATDTPVWVVQLHLISYSRNAVDELGINVETAAKAGLAFASGSALGGARISWELATSLDAVLQVAYSRDDVAVTAAPMFIVSDGEKASFVQGDRVPIPRRTVSPEGTVTTAGFDYVQTGVNVELTLRETAERAARVDVVVNMSDVKRFVEEAPVTGEERFQTGAVIKAGGVYLLGTLVKDRSRGRNALGWQSQEYLSWEAQVVQVWAHTYRIGGAVVTSAIPSGEGVQGAEVAPAGPEASANRVEKGWVSASGGSSDKP
jgi:type II secretory pathway component GspD/PulD (secretin)